MGGSQNIGEESDNPVEINVTAMVDVIFCLCIFFMCSFHFKQLEGKIDAWMPKDGNQPGEVKDKILFEEVRIFMKWDAAGNKTIRKIGNRVPVETDGQLTQTIDDMKKDYEKAGKTEVPVVIDATADVPWQDVVHVVDLCKSAKLSPIKFTEPMQYRPENR